METYKKHDPLANCIDAAVFALELVDAWICEFIRDLGEAAELPNKFTIDDERWIAARDLIEAEAAKKDFNATFAACLDYRTRAARFLTGWRAKLGMPPREYPQ